MNKHLTGWLQYDLLAGITVLNLGLAVLTALIVFAVLYLALRFFSERARKVAGRMRRHRTGDMLIDVLSSTSLWMIALVALLVGVGVLELPGRWNTRVDQLWFIVVAMQLGMWLNRAVTLGVYRYETDGDPSATPQISASATLMSWALRTVLWAVVLLAALDNLGVNITAFVASLGVGGIAVALAVQTILSDLFASLSIAVDKPFEVGHFIIFGDVLGTVTHIGLKTTRIAALSGQQIIIANAELLKQTINNYKFMAERRVVFTFGLTYDTTPEQAEAVAALVQRIVKGIDQTRFDRGHFKGFSQSALDYEVVYYVLDGSYNLYMDIQQSINLQLMRGVAEMGVHFAWPRSTVQVVAQTMPGDDAPLPAGAAPGAAARLS